jgi:hypothetical protein
VKRQRRSAVNEKGGRSHRGTKTAISRKIWSGTGEHKIHCFCDPRRLGSSALSRSEPGRLSCRLQAGLELIRP